MFLLDKPGRTKESRGEHEKNKRTERQRTDFGRVARWPERTDKNRTEQKGTEKGKVA